MDPKLKRQFLLLGITPDASHSEIRTAYKRRAAALHPDRTGGTTTEQFQALREAYQAVMHYHKRQQALIKQREDLKAGQQTALNRQRLATAYQQRPAQRSASGTTAAPERAATKPKATTSASASAKGTGAGKARTKPRTAKSGRPNYWLWALILTGTLLIAISLWLYRHPPAPSVSVQPPVPASQAPALSIETPAGHRPSFPEERLGSGYSLSFAPLYEIAPEESNPPLPELLAPPLQPLDVIEQIGHGWLRVAFAGKRYYTPEHLVGYGDARLAQRFDCTQYPLPQPLSGEILQGQSGTRQLQVYNPHQQDALISFIDAQKLLQQVYLRSQDRIMLYQVPANASAARIEYGQFYNKGCGHFTADYREKQLKITLLGGWQTLELP